MVSQESFRKTISVCIKTNCSWVTSEPTAHVEQELERNFSWASRWGCILLLDEAEVFLSARERKDFRRNGLVAGTLHTTNCLHGVD